MKIKNLLFSLLAGGSLALGGGLVYKKRRERVEAVRSDREKMKHIVVLALSGLPPYPTKAGFPPRKFISLSGL